MGLVQLSAVGSPDGQWRAREIAKEMAGSPMKFRRAKNFLGFCLVKAVRGWHRDYEVREWEGTHSREEVEQQMRDQGDPASFVPHNPSPPAPYLELRSLLPLPIQGEVFLDERGAILAAIHDAYWVADRKIGPWADDDRSLDATLYRTLVEVVSSEGLTSKDADFVRQWLADTIAAYQKTEPEPRLPGTSGTPPTGAMDAGEGDGGVGTGQDRTPTASDQSAQATIPAPPSSVADLPDWIQSARELLRDREDQPIDENGTASLVQNGFLEHLERLCHDQWPGWFFTFHPERFATVRELVAMMAWVEQNISAESPPPAVVTGFAAGSDEAVSLTKEDMAILEALYAKRPQAMTQEALTQRDAADLCLRTVRDRLKFLVEAGFVCKPHGPKKGYALTEKAVAILEKRPPT
jgi:predicted transcriptional regulator